jgi:putative membrane protein
MKHRDLSSGKGTRDRLALFLSLSPLGPSTAWAHNGPAAVIDPTRRALLTAWSFRADVMLVMVVLTVVYTSGWWRLRNKGCCDTRRSWQAALYLGGLMVLCVALLSPIDRLAGALFLMHMLQHLLLMMVAAPLLLCANPLPVFLWALPRRARHRLGRLLSRDAMVRSGLRALPWMPLAWPVFVVNLWAWHHPAIYQVALRHDRIHDLEHLTFFGTALLFWWPIINPAPWVRGRIHPGLQLVYLMVATGQNIRLGAVIALTRRVLYPF